MKHKPPVGENKPLTALQISAKLRKVIEGFNSMPNKAVAFQEACRIYNTSYMEELKLQDIDYYMALRDALYNYFPNQNYMWLS